MTPELVSYKLLSLEDTMKKVVALQEGQAELNYTMRETLKLLQADVIEHKRHHEEDLDPKLLKLDETNIKFRGVTALLYSFGGFMVGGSLVGAFVIELLNHTHK